MRFEDFNIRSDAAELVSAVSAERTGEQIDQIKIDFNAIKGRPVFEWHGSVLTITFDRTADGRVQ